MNKAEKLLEYLLNSPLQLRRDQAMLVIDNGNTLSYASDQNKHFAMQYQAMLLITDFTGNVASLLFTLLCWMDLYQPDHGDNAIQFEIDVLNHEQVDLTLKIQLTERIAVSETPAGIALDHLDDPTMEPALLGTTLKDLLALKK